MKYNNKQIQRIAGIRAHLAAASGKINQLNIELKTDSDLQIVEKHTNMAYKNLIKTVQKSI